MISSKSQKAYVMGKQLCTALRVPNMKMTIVDTLQDYTITKKVLWSVFGKFFQQASFSTNEQWKPVQAIRYHFG